MCVHVSEPEVLGRSRWILASQGNYLRTSDTLTNCTGMLITTLAIFVVLQPIAAFCLIWFSHHLLMRAIPQIDGELIKTRTDIFAMRAAYACFIVGLAVAGLWSLGLTVLGLIAGIRILLG